jgi:hypothetical protein
MVSQEKHLQFAAVGGLEKDDEVLSHLTLHALAAVGGGLILLHERMFNTISFEALTMTR